MTALIAIGVTLAGLSLAVWQARRSGHADYRTRNDRAMARRYATFRPTPEVQQPGSDHQLYLDCIAVYGEHPDLDRLLDQQRKEKPQP